MKKKKTFLSTSSAIKISIFEPLAVQPQTLSALEVVERLKLKYVKFRILWLSTNCIGAMMFPGGSGSLGARLNRIDFTWGMAIGSPCHHRCFGYADIGNLIDYIICHKI